MTEYINRALALREVERWQKGITVNIKAELKALHAENVVERSKIDKAIEEIENEIKFWDCPVNYQEPLEVQRNKQAKANSYKHALEILKSNIEG